MASKPECIDCGTIYDVRRWKLGYNICLDQANSRRAKAQDWCSTNRAQARGNSCHT